jgi:hypothetical protein
MSRVPLSAAVWLSLNVEPDGVPLKRHWQGDFGPRLAVAQSHFVGAVDLSEFAGWARALPRPWKIPPELAELSQEPEQKQQAAQHAAVLIPQPAAAPTADASAAAVRPGLTPRQIADAFGVVDAAQQIKLKGWGRDEWLNAFQDGRAKWIKELKLSNADRRKQIPATFDPLGVAKALIESHAPVQHVRRAFENSLLQPWRDEFERYLISTDAYR